MKCKHKDGKGNSTIDGDTCLLCNEEFGSKFFQKEQEKKKRDKKNSYREDE